MALGQDYLASGFICHDEYFLCFFACGRGLADIFELALFLFGIRKKATFSVLDFSDRWDPGVSWGFFPLGKPHGELALLAFFLDGGGFPGIGHAIIYHQIRKSK